MQHTAVRLEIEMQAGNGKSGFGYDVLRSERAPTLVSHKVCAKRTTIGKPAG